MCVDIKVEVELLKVCFVSPFIINVLSQKIRDHGHPISLWSVSVCLFIRRTVVPMKVFVCDF